MCTPKFNRKTVLDIVSISGAKFILLLDAAELDVSLYLTENGNQHPTRFQPTCYLDGPVVCIGLWS